jgi:hypothetical protein
MTRDRLQSHFRIADGGVEAYILDMKIMGTFGVVVIASIALLQPADGRQRGGGGHGRSFSSGHNFSGAGRNYSNHSRNFSRSTANNYRSSPRASSQAAYNRAYRNSGSSRRYSSQAAYRNRDYSAYGRRRSVNRTTALNPRSYSAARQRVSSNRRSDYRARGFNNNQSRVQARYSRNWNRNRDYNWRGNRCRWHNNSWVIIGPWFPWGYGYGYYPYASYSYYNGGYYDDAYATSEYSEEPARSEYDSGAADFSVSGVQSALAREGYYDGPIDGSLGPATRNALRRYQRDRGLSVTGRIDRAVAESLGLRN